MIRIISILVGLGFATVVLISFGVGAYTAATETVEETAEHAFHEEPLHIGFSSDGPLGNWDIAQLQRGYKVYREVCAACHSMKYVAFRDLADLGYSESQVEALAAGVQVAGIDENTGEANMRPATPTDYFPSPYPNNVAAAAANGGKVPPDLSLMSKARHHGPQYVVSLLTGYRDAETYTNEDGERFAEAYPDAMPGPGNYFNPYYPNLNIAMAPPLTTAGQVTYDDGTEATVGQMAVDVAAFLTWTAEPAMIKRKQTGLAVLGFLLFATFLAYLSKQHIWAAVKPKNAKKGPLQG